MIFSFARRPLMELEKVLRAKMQANVASCSVSVINLR